MGYTLRDLFYKGMKNNISKEERDYYIKHFMSEEEIEIGKPLFEMDEYEKVKYEVLTYNNTEGDLIGYDCKLCKNKGNIYFLKDNKKYVKDCKCIKLRNTFIMLEKYGLLYEFSVCRFETFICESKWQSKLLDKCKQFVESKVKAIALLGQTGCGKTHLSMAILRQFALQFKTVAYMRWVEDSKALKQVTNDNGMYQASIYPYKNCDVLYIDDLFKGDMTEADRKIAFEIIDYRYKLSRSNDRYITIISSERTFEEIRQFDEAIAGRIAEMTNKEYILQIGKDENKNYRLKGII